MQWSSFRLLFDGVECGMPRRIVKVGECGMRNGGKDTICHLLPYSAFRIPHSALPIQRLATCRANTETTLVMTINDPIIHPALLDPRQWAEVDLYCATSNIDREAISGPERHTPDRKVEIKHLKLNLRFDN